ncbi:MAG: YjbF family lipoprotein [Candidatus Saccharibacteria bacterium]|nr:YjbF family lipoprotein [Rhodoferax sp.]
MAAVYRQGLGASNNAGIPALANPALNYLRVEVAGHPPGLLVLGYVDHQPEGDVQVWYSANQEVLKTLNGRIVQTSGLPADWLLVSFPVAPLLWQGLANDAVAFTRTRDAMPAYRYGIQETMTLSRSRPPAAVSASVAPRLAGELQWYRESVVASSEVLLPDAYYGVGIWRGEKTVIYSQQCLATDFCLRLMRWPLNEVTP